MFLALAFTIRHSSPKTYSSASAHVWWEIDVRAKSFSKNWLNCLSLPAPQKTFQVYKGLSQSLWFHHCHSEAELTDIITERQNQAVVHCDSPRNIHYFKWLSYNLSIAKSKICPWTNPMLSLMENDVNCLTLEGTFYHFLFQVHEKVHSTRMTDWNILSWFALITAQHYNEVFVFKAE